MGQAEQDPDLPCSASNVLGKVQSQGVPGQVEVPVRQVNFRGSLPLSENNVLQPMLHPEAAGFDFLGRQIVFPYVLSLFQEGN